VAIAAFQAYNLGMRKMVCFLLFVGLSLSGQPTPSERAAAKLDSILAEMRNPRAARNPLSQELADVIISLAHADHKPSRSIVVGFTNELTDALIGKDVKTGAKWLLTPILEILDTSGTTFTKAIRLRAMLTSVGVDGLRTQRVTAQFIKIGEGLRGPDDIPLEN
jgi:hypothetical protein